MADVYGVVVAVGQDGKSGDDVSVLCWYQGECVVGGLTVEVVQIADLFGEDAVGGEQQLGLVGERQCFGRMLCGGLEYGGDLLVQGTVVGAGDETERLLVGHVDGPGVG